ncbi:SDR family oxidoreductase [Mucilaginibacter myungsuensis]|uniref:SDR family NAD(P)-dependent oxidoreductase n=1 Tax=Mucilaginibacter myungsuensis TaxID=649104 RepID=A0A929KYU2_9SPHI|nr:SDR family NAD(P)-dependent oxidoreductase [Mucilaginibacter myungsuensis]MBE9663152.1 SDR family NAD(P)-dependent oxidoreductase [Mucilaginibacter myungsuensis]MDN3598787.1 SDR family NAD(P)-dependent oxidoreductase [Mucilaginibacter myungsuensis]
MKLQNSTVLITGGSSGIGRELVKQLTDQGANIIITGRDLNKLTETQRQFPSIHVFQSDVSDPESIRQLYNNVIRQFPDLNILINNAGEMRLLDLQDTGKSLENITREIDINLSGTIQMVHQFLPHLVNKKSAAIVNVSSGIAFMPFSVAPVYSASKAGVRAYTQALRLQLKGTGVKVFEMIPPGVKTNLQKDWVLPTDSNSSLSMDVDKMVNVAIEGLQKDKPELRPFLIGVIKWASRIVPGALMNFGHKEFERFKQLNKNANHSTK